MRRYPTSPITILLLALLAGAWLLLAPTQIGGRAAYVIVSGISMEPLYHRGDLVVVRRAAAYQAGDIVTYRHPQIGPVIHRIVGRAGDRFVLKGDNNSWLDAYRPTEAELIGAAWLHLPKAGAVLARLRSPLIVGGLALVGAAGMLPARPSRRRRGRRKGSLPMGHLDETKASLLVACGMLLLAAAALAALAFARPTTRAVPRELPYEQIGQFSYAAAAPAGVYDGDAPRPGDPIFRRLSREVPVEFSYRLAGDQSSAVAGVYRLRVEVGDGNGWRRTVAETPEQRFTGDAFTARVVIDLARVQALIDSFQRQTEIERPEYVVTVAPTVAVSGTLSGQALDTTFAPRLQFRLDRLQLRLMTDSNGADVLKPVQAGTLSGTRVEPNTLALPGLRLAVTTARRVALLGLALAGAGIVLLGLPLARALQRDETLRIKLKYGGLLVAIRANELAQSERVIAVATIDDLARLAERLGSAILYEAGGGYFVHEAGVTYRYQPGAVPVPEAAPRAAPPWQTTFLDALRERGLVAEACAAAGIWLATAYQERERSPAFAWAWDQACAGRTSASEPESDAR